MVKIQTPRFVDGEVRFTATELVRNHRYEARLAGPAEFGTIDRPVHPNASGTAAKIGVPLVDAPSGPYVAQVVDVGVTPEVVVAESEFHVVGTVTADEEPPPARVQLARTATTPTSDVVLTQEILRVTRARRFAEYQLHVDRSLQRETNGAFSPAAYDVILRATREFLERDTTTIIDPGGNYLEGGNLPYLENVASRYPDARLGRTAADGVADIDEELLARPAPVELIWTYWNEEGASFQAMNLILARFQNRRLPNGLALERFSLSYLRPLRNLLYTWGDHEIDRLTVRRRAAEYEYEYGLSLIGRAVPGSLQYVERRSQFLESFHTLLHEALRFHRLDDDTTVVADGFPVLNALRDLHRTLAPGAENQFDGVALQSRVETMAMQYVLAQPEMREFLGGRPMVPYEEPWMDKVDTVRTLCGWGDTSVMSFHELAVHGEQLVMSVRWGDWSDISLTADSAANWARLMRDPVHRYVHAYRTVTGVDLQLGVDATMPAVLLARRSRARVRA
ncbi:hypothetical protein H9657_04505 [Cellulomonas sp. Sa3CUA2]|uniref:Uncharacterized protein n=1 Tax=Cellulomonas avistercoris TaxID=2762242 RepID=A0ABR8QAU4_9CELL|nr:hypothetical protein [Cellulomonas avistercoris]MBD7917540.1 hypothetical protein [Cellulomonas avistercoris]